VLVAHDADLWSTEYELAWQGGLVPIPVRMTVIRLGDGRLVLHSPAPPTAALRSEIDALGRVGFLVIPWAHGRYAEEAARAWPDAQLLAAPEPPARRRSLAFRGSLADEPPAAWAGRVETHLVRGFRLSEVVLFHRPSRTLVITDLCFNVQRSDRPVARLFFRANGMWQRFGPSRLIRLLAPSDRAALRGSIERILAWDFERIVPGHGDVLERGGPAALRAAWLR
jgi:uncharacterized protein DUF4336